MKIFFSLFLIFIFGCEINNRSNISESNLKGNEISETTLVANKMKFEEGEFAYSNYSFIQANNSGLYITTPKINNGYVLFKYILNTKDHTVKVDSFVRSGRGPNEIESIFMSSKTIDGDTLMFTTPSDKMLTIDQKGLLSEWDVDTKRITNFGFSFSYSNGKLLIPSFSPIQKEYLFKIYDVRNDEVYDSFTPRVPYGYQPSVRNEILGETPVPDGFAISFLGDRKIYILDSMGKIKKEIIIGKSDEIPQPYKVSNPQETPGAKPYITKMEFYNDHLLVLMDNVIWIIKYPSLEVKSRIRLLKNLEVSESAVIDFSISDDYLYSRIGRDGMFFNETNSDWFN
ncbi:MAG: hypothetical protein RI561_10575 [Gracilimonas sp.]|nr:hypothetical protein [Gracilimonas sp.]